MDLNPIYLRLKQAVDWLKFNRHMMKQDIAAKMEMTGVSFSRGLARCKEKNDEDFVIRFHQATGEIFSLDWLLHGTGEKFTADIKKAEPAPTTPVSAIDPSSAVNASIAAYVKLYEFAESKLADKEKEMADRLADKETIIVEKQSRIESLERTISNLERTVADKEAIIRARDARILELERRIAQSSADDLTKYPFTIGAAEQNENLNQ